MSHLYDSIIIVPTMANDLMDMTRTIPVNASVINLDIDITLLGKIKMVANCYKTVLMRLIAKQDQLSFGSSIQQVAYSFYYYCRVEYVYKKTVEALENIISYNDDIIIYSYWLHVTASIAARLKNRLLPGALAISRAHRYDLYDDVSPLNFIPDRYYVLDALNKVYPCSDDGTNYLKSSFPQFSEIIETKRLGTARRTPVECNNNSIYLVSCSSISKVKRLDKIIDVIFELQSNGFSVQWSHIGDGALNKEIKEYANSKLNNGSFTFLGHLKNEEVITYYQTNPITLFINLSDSEGVPVSIMEAQSLAIPVLATNVGGTKELIDHCQNGFLVSKDDDSETIASYIINVHNMESSEYHELCNKSFRTWENKADAFALYSSFHKDIISKVNDNGSRIN